MWEQESNKYWKEKRSQSFQKKVSVNKTTIIAGVAVLLLLIVGGVGYFMTASRGKPVVLSDEPIRSAAGRRPSRLPPSAAFPAPPRTVPSPAPHPARPTRASDFSR